jgi:hypothetical protein
MEETKLFPSRLKPRKMTKKEIEDWKDFRKTSAIEFLSGHIDYVCKLYSEVFRVLYFKPDENASIIPVLKMIDNIDKLLNSYERST